MKLEYKKDKKGKWYWIFKAKNGEKIDPRQGYENKKDMEHAIDLIRQFFVKDYMPKGFVPTHTITIKKKEKWWQSMLKGAKFFAHAMLIGLGLAYLAIQLAVILFDYQFFGKMLDFIRNITL